MPCAVLIATTNFKVERFKNNKPEDNMPKPKNRLPEPGTPRPTNEQLSANRSPKALNLNGNIALSQFSTGTELAESTITYLDIVLSATIDYAQPRHTRPEGE